MKIIVLGAGNWGTVLAKLFCKKNKVHLWTIDKNHAESLNNNRNNLMGLPGVEIDKEIIIEEKYASPINADDIIILAVPSRKISEVCVELKNQGVEKNILVNVSKGVEHNTLKTIKQIVRDYMPNLKFVNLSGPTIAKELAMGLPAKAVLASRHMETLFYLNKVLDNPYLKFEYSRDIDGSEICASLKGIIAIAVGLADGFGFETNMFGLIITYGLREFSVVNEFLRVDKKTVYSIAGMGDLITTCLSENSRNRTFGKLLALGNSTDDALKKVGMEVEGVSMSKTVQKMSHFNINIPLINCIANIIFGNIENKKQLLLDTINNISG